MVFLIDLLQDNNLLILLQRELNEYLKKKKSETPKMLLLIFIETRKTSQAFLEKGSKIS